MREKRTRLVIVVILTVALYLSLRWVAFTFEAEIEGMMVRIEYQRVEKGVGNPPELIMPWGSTQIVRPLREGDKTPTTCIRGEGVLYYCGEQYNAKPNRRRPMTTMRVSQKGWVVIPAHLREKYNIQPGDEVAIVDYGGVLTIVPLPEDPIKAGYGMLKGEPSLTEALLEERAKERARER